MGLGRGSAGIRPGDWDWSRQAKGQDWPGLNTEKSPAALLNICKNEAYCLDIELVSLVMDSPSLTGHWFSSYPHTTLSLEQIWLQNQCYNMCQGHTMGLDGTGSKSAGRSPGLGLDSQAKGQDWPGLGLESQDEDRD